MQPARKFDQNYHTKVLVAFANGGGPRGILPYMLIVRAGLIVLQLDVMVIAPHEMQHCLIEARPFIKGLNLFKV